MLAGLQQKLKYSDRERTFCCLVAESAEQPGVLAGVVEVSLQGEPVRAPCFVLVHEGSRSKAVSLQCGGVTRGRAGARPASSLSTGKVAARQGCCSVKELP